jgi:hypothetical protein
LSVNATTLGVSRLPSALAMTLGSLPSMMDTTEFVVPKSIPMIFSPLAMKVASCSYCLMFRVWCFDRPKLIDR